MRQLFAPGADAVFRLSMLVVVAGVVGFFIVTAEFSRSSFATGVGVAPDQPAPFSHKHHSGELGLDCRYCHQGVEKLATAGIPPTWTCMTCHSQIWTGASMLEPVRASLAHNTPLEWNRVNRLPSYVYFNHSIHVTKGVGCSTCHGELTAMQLTYRANAFEMQFCVTCHRNPERFIRPQSEIFNMTWSPPADQDKVGPALAAKYHIGRAENLTDCSICHR